MQMKEQNTRLAMEVQSLRERILQFENSTSYFENSRMTRPNNIASPNNIPTQSYLANPNQEMNLSRSRNNFML